MVIVGDVFGLMLLVKVSLCMLYVVLELVVGVLLVILFEYVDCGLYFVDGVVIIDGEMFDLYYFVVLEFGGDVMFIV